MIVKQTKPEFAVNGDEKTQILLKISPKRCFSFLPESSFSKKILEKLFDIKEN